MQKYLRKRRVAHKVTKFEGELAVAKKSYKLSPSQILAKEIASEISGLAPYEKKAIDMIRGDNQKKARKFLKNRLGSMARAEKKFEKLCEIAR
ncbi:large subunit ribosomal protein L36e [Enteropsectra breve]|nr:large subunit ribosomal protein L36e [Enteropsectra breve]KAI5150798.1 large subunit ribosomal protein L36e [Enteropsectra breve]